jgi:O-antigen/teichoic acid export membrane protein
MQVNSIKSGAIWSMVGQLVNIVFGTAILILTTRYLGPDQYGLLQTILTLIILSVMVADFGFSSSVAKYVAENQNNLLLKSQYISNGLIIKMLTSLLMVLLIISTLPFLEELLNVELEEYKFQLIVITLLRSLREFLLKVLQGLRRLDLSTKLNIFYNVGSMVLVTVFLLLGFGINAVLISEVLISLLFLGIFVLTNFRVQMFSYHGLEKISLKNILIYSVPMFLISMSFYLYMKADTLMIQYFMDSASVGFYSLATMIIGKVHMPMVAIGQATGPVLVSLRKDQRSAKLVQVLKVTLLLTLPICIGLFLVTEELISVIFGEEFLPTIKVLKLMTIFLFFYSLNSVLSPVLDYLGYARKRAVMVAISAGINICLNALLIPKIGIEGAVYSTLLTYSFYSIIIIITIFKFVIKRESFKELSKLFLKILLVAILMGIVVFMTDLFIKTEPVSLVLSILIGIVSYILLIYRIGLISKSEIINFLKRKSKRKR